MDIFVITTKSANVLRTQKRTHRPNDQYKVSIEITLCRNQRQKQIINENKNSETKQKTQSESNENENELIGRW